MPDIKSKISDGSEKAINASPAPAPVKEKLQKDFETKQNDYANKVVNAFSDSIHKIFIVTSSIMVVAFLTSFAIKERELASALPSETPGE